MTIVEFLEARLDEDEAVARSAFIDHEPKTAEWIERGNEVVNSDGSLVVSRTWNEVTHIARQGPARTLREVAAKRAIIADHRRFMAEERRRMNGWVPNEWDLPILKALASVYSDHPDYQQEWATP